MNSDKNYSQFVEHSFRRLNLLIQQQENINSSSPLENNPSEMKQGPMKSIGQHQRSYMRPPKNRPNVSSRCSSSQLSEHSMKDQPLICPSSPLIDEKESKNLPVHMPVEQTVYDIRFERDRQNDLRERFNIPPPFQRKWLRQPRYIPQERPDVGQINLDHHSHV